MTKALARDLFNWLDWDSSFYNYQRSVLDSKPYHMIREESKTTIVFNGLGISEDDIKVEVVTVQGMDYLEISGETKNYGRNFNVNGRFSLDRDSVKDISWSTNNGLIVLTVNFKEVEKSKVEIRKV